MHAPLYGTPRPPHAPLGPLSPPLLRASTTAQPDAEAVRRLGAGLSPEPFYQRLCHDNGLWFESLCAEREGADGAVAFASGMAATSGAILALVRHGDRVLVPHEVYGGTAAFAAQDLPRFGVEVARFGSFDDDGLERELRRGARLVVLETPVNPTLRIVDLARKTALCHQHGALVLVDSTFAPPPIQRPLQLGADLVMHSATKFYGGHSDVLAGVVLGRHELLAPIEAFRRRTGAVLAPDAAWLLCRSWPTLDLRLESQQRDALALAERLVALCAQGRLEAVIHPGLPSHPDHALAARQMRGFGTMLSFVVPGGMQGALSCYDRFRRIARAASLGSVESLASLPAYTTHAPISQAERERAGIPDGLIRISVGLEGVEALYADIEQALAQAS